MFLFSVIFGVKVIIPNKDKPRDEKNIPTTSPRSSGALVNISPRRGVLVAGGVLAGSSSKIFEKKMQEHYDYYFVEELQ